MRLVFFTLKKIIEKETDNEQTKLHFHFKDGGDAGDYDDYLPLYLQEVTQKAFYLLAWGRIERFIDDKLRDLIKLKLTSENFSERQGWTIYNPNKKFTHFKLETKLNLLFDCEKEDKLYKNISKIYENRNIIAHGNDEFETIDLTEILEIDKALFALLYIPNPKAEAEEKAQIEQLIEDLS